MRAVELLEKKKRGGSLSRDELEYLVGGYIKDEIPDYQMAAFLMAVYFRGLDERETADLTMIMRDSGDVVRLEGIRGLTVDKHSTGGVGDKTTLVLAPLVASLGLRMAKMSGRGLGHTGGTLDKLESLKGFRTMLDPEEFIECVNTHGLAVVGQTANLVPADKKLYALRDVTATVDQVSLIASSIMSKKLAVENDALVLDVKVGNGAFMKTRDDAVRLAEAMVSIGKSAGRRVRAVVTDMNQPLGRAVGNAVEVKEAVETLQGGGPADFREVVLTLAANLLEMTGKSSSVDEGRSKAEEHLANGAAWSKFLDFIRAQGAAPDAVDTLEIASREYVLEARSDGWLVEVDTEGVGVAAMRLGAGRARKEDVIDTSVGFVVEKKLGERVEKGEPLVRVLYRDENKLHDCLDVLRKCFVVGEERVPPPPLVYGVIS